MSSTEPKPHGYHSAPKVKKASSPITVRSGKIEFLKFNATKHNWRDSYHAILSLSWPQFVAFVLGIYLALVLVFAVAYSIGGACVAEMRPGYFPDAFFFSVETLATVGYGHMYPVGFVGHLIATLEIVAGTFWVAVITGLVFVRFSRPTARIEFSTSVVISAFDGQPTLMLRLANLRHTSVAEAEFRMIFMRDETVAEGGIFRRFYPLKLQFDRVITLPAALTIRHVIDEHSPLYGATAETLAASDARLMASVVCIETVVAATVQSQQDYSWNEFRFGERFVEIYNELEDGRLGVDYGRLHETESAP
ncbi:MAG: ion channel [Verrucomicrobiota bacterium]|nr:ion channel [Verrucomicrobiota bacterium]